MANANVVQMAPTPIAEVRIPITLDRPRMLIFNANTLMGYEDVTRRPECPDGKFYWDTITRLYEFYSENQREISELWPVVFAADGKTCVDPPEKIRRRTIFSRRIMHYISVRDLVAILWAALHEYPSNDPDADPIHPLTMTQVARYVTPLRTLSLVFLVLQGHNENAPSKAELGEASGPQNQQHAPAESAPRVVVNGGGASTELDADAFE